MEDSARADMMFTAAAQQAQSASAGVLWAAATNQSPKTETKPNGNSQESSPFSRVSQEHFQAPEVEPEEDDTDDDDDDENYEDDDYDHDDQGEFYYNEVSNCLILKVIHKLVSVIVKFVNLVMIIRKLV